MLYYLPPRPTPPPPPPRPPPLKPPPPPPPKLPPLDPPPKLPLLIEELRDEEEDEDEDERYESVLREDWLKPLFDVSVLVAFLVERDVEVLSERGVYPSRVTGWRPPLEEPPL